MTLYRLAAVEFVRDIDHTEMCAECGRPADGPRVIERKRFRHGDLIEVDGAEELRLLAAGALVPVDQNEGGGAAAEDAEAVAPPAIGSADTPVEAEADESDGDKPKRTANVAAWRDYAITQGIDGAEAAELTKAELIELVG